MKKINRLKRIFFIVSVIIFAAVSFYPVGAYQVTPPPKGLYNGDFEDHPGVGGSANYYTIKQDKLPGWLTTAPDGIIEIWTSGYKPSKYLTAYSHGGGYLCELNANYASAIYQDISTDKGSLYKWIVWHRGRNGVDAAELLLGAPEDESPSADIDGKMDISDGYEEWGLHFGYYKADTEITRFKLSSISTAGGKASQGNLVDDLDFFKAASPTEQTVTLGSERPHPSTLANFNIDGLELESQYADNQEYSESETDENGEAVSPPDFSKTGRHRVKVKILDREGRIAGYIYSTVNIISAEGTTQSLQTVSPAEQTTEDMRTQDEKTVSINYVDENGAIIKEPHITYYRTGVEYSVTPPVAGTELTVGNSIYIFVKVKEGSAPLNGIIDASKVITYVYRLKGESEASDSFVLTVRFFDESGHKLTEDESKLLKKGAYYNASAYAGADALTYEGRSYSFTKIKPGSDPLSGIMDKDKTVVLVFSIYGEPVPKTGGGGVFMWLSLAVLSCETLVIAKKTYRS